jgi:hypothetical protein
MQEKAKETLYGRLHTFINSIYERDGHFAFLEKIVSVLRYAYPKLNQTGESAFSKAPESVFVNQFDEDKHSSSAANLEYNTDKQSH